MSASRSRPGSRTREGRTTEALALMRAAADAEDRNEKHIVTPGRILPARELLGRHADRAEAPGGGPEGVRGLAAARARPLPGPYGAARAAVQSGDGRRPGTTTSSWSTWRARATRGPISPRPARSWPRIPEAPSAEEVDQLLERDHLVALGGGRHHDQRLHARRVPGLDAVADLRRRCRRA